MRLDVWPFIIGYLTLFHFLYHADIYSTDYAKELANEIEDPSLELKMALFGIPVLLSLQVLIFLVSQWSMSLKCSLGYVSVKTIPEANMVHVVAAKNAGKDRIVPVMMIKVDPKQPKAMEVSIANTKYHCYTKFFEFQKVKYEYDPKEKNNFVKSESPTTGKVQDFLTCTGVAEQDRLMCMQKWGINEFDIPIPPFLDLYMEHLTAPFFVFQMLCLFLWSLDDYWYYSAFTLLMLMFFEGMLCKQRLDGLQMLRNMRRPAMPIQVYRSGGWKLMSSEGLVPGDIVALTTYKFEDDVQLQQQQGSSGENDGVRDESKHSDDIVLPCDALIVRGSCVVNEAMLTGESVPQIKETLRTFEDQERGVVQLGGEGNSADAVWKRHLVYGGTALVQDSTLHSNDERSPCKLDPPPAGGCTAVVVRTGFSTTQGGLMRKILFATERVNATSTETVYFIAVLVVFALIASAVVLHGGLHDESRNKFKLVLHCIMIVTSVVPPELPMELSLAVTNSLAALSRHLVFCTEPFRIPFAGKLDILCFDKTGTLTKDRMILRGIVAAYDVKIGGDGRAHSVVGEEVLNNEELPQKVRFGVKPLPIYKGSTEEAVKDDAVCPNIVLAIMATCNSLFVNKGQIQGDPMEVETHALSGFQVAGGLGTATSTDLGMQTHAARKMTVLRAKMYPFSSALKRMSVIVRVGGWPLHIVPGSTEGMWVLTKGAPEVLADMLVGGGPTFYREAYQYHMARGKRVLALACKKHTGGEPRDVTRASAESGLTFVGFLVYDCDLKADTKSVIRELRLSNHRVMMITGDSPYTAADISKRISLVKSDGGVLMLRPVDGAKCVWRSTDKGESAGKVEGDIDFDADSVGSLAKGYDLCVIGPALLALGSEGRDRASTLKKLCPHVNIFARVSPAQKEEVIAALKDARLTTLMCGDGTNEVGALKCAHVGVSIVNDPDFESSIENSVSPTQAEAGSKKAKGTSAKDRMSRALAELQKQEADPTIVKLGDASIASPFTARRTSVDSVLTVLRQGRCTLVTTIQVFKILALNCLVSAFMMSALYLRGLKQGDIQMTATGLVTAGLFFFLSQAKPMEAISPARPPPSVFSPSVLVSVLGQFVVHMASLLYTLHICEEYIQPDDLTMSTDGKFYPNIINSAMFLLSATMQVNNFVVNYRGHPFTQSITENKYLWRSVQGIYAALVIVAGGQLEPINDLLQLSAFPNPTFQATLLGTLGLNFAASFVVEKVARRLE